MKRTIALLLTLTLLAACLVLLPACSKVGEKDYEKNPAELLSEAQARAGESFFIGDSPLSSVLRDAMKGGALSVAYNTEVDGTPLGISGTVYADEESKRGVLDATLQMNGESLGGRLFVDSKGLILSSTDLLGSDDAVGIFPAELAEYFSTSALADLLCEGDAEMRQQMNRIMESLADSWETAFAEQEDNYTFLNQLIAHMNGQTATEKLDVDGKTQKCLTVTYTLNNENLKTVMDKIVAEYAKMVENLPATNGEPGFEEDGLADEWETLYEELNENYQISATLKFAINRKNAAMAAIYADVDVTPKGEIGKATSFTLEATYSVNRICIDGELTEDGETDGGALVLTKYASKDGVQYVGEIEVRDGDESFVGARVTVDFDVAGGTAYAELSVRGEADDPLRTFRLDGELSLDKTALTLTVNKLTLPDEAPDPVIELDLSLTLDVAAKMPAVPEAPKDVVKLTEEELVTLLQGISEGKLGHLIEKRK